MSSIDYSKKTTEELLEYVMQYQVNVKAYGEDLQIINQILKDRREGIVPIASKMKRGKGKYSYNSQVGFNTAEEAHMAEERDLAINELLAMCDWTKRSRHCYTPGLSADNDSWVSVVVSQNDLMTHPYRFASSESCIKAITKLGKRKLNLVFGVPVGPGCPCPPGPIPPCPPGPVPPCPPPVPPYPPRPEHITVHLELNPPGGEYQMGETIPFPIQMIAHVHGRSQNPVFIQFSRDGEVIYSVPYISGTCDRYVFNYNDPCKPINKNTHFSVAVIDGIDIVQDCASYIFGYPCYAGYSEDGEAPDSLIGMIRVGLEKRNFSYKFTCYGKYPLVMYPANWGELDSIKDANDFTITNTFNHSIKVIPMIDGTPISYHVYVIDHPVDVTDYKMKFNFIEE